MYKSYSRRAFLQALTSSIAGMALVKQAQANPFFTLMSYWQSGSIGIPGAAGFGVGVVPTLPSGFSRLSGTNTLGHDNYGNYQYADGSIMVWIPAFYYRIGHASNPTYATYGVNSVDVQPISAFGSLAVANAAGYALHRAFIDGSTVKSGFMVDKYLCSKNAKGTGYVGSSIKNGLAVSFSASHNAITDLTAATSTALFNAIECAHARDGENGAVNANSIFFPTSRFIYAALSLLAMAHGQASSATTNCAWYDSGGTANAPKGCNNDSLSDTNDTSVIWESDGYSACGKTGSAGYGGGVGNLFAKSTHNGQNCGVADVNGLMWEVSTGVTCKGTYAPIEGLSSANPCVVDWVGHGLSTGDVVYLKDITQADWTGLNDKMFSVTYIGADSFSIGVDTSTFAAYDFSADPGTIRKSTFLVAKESTSMKDFTSGTSADSDHWNVTTYPAFDAVVPVFRTDYSSNGQHQKFGNSTNQVFSGDTSGNDWVLTGLGLPGASTGVSSSGSANFQTDYYHQYILDQVFLATGGDWDDAASAGMHAMRMAYSRTSAVLTFSYRCACYPI